MPRQALHSKVLQQFLKRAAFCAGAVQQPLADGGTQIAGRSQHRLQVGPHHLFDPIHSRELGDQLKVRLPRSLTVCSERLDSHIESDHSPRQRRCQY